MKPRAGMAAAALLLFVLALWAVAPSTRAPSPDEPTDSPMIPGRAWEPGGPGVASRPGDPHGAPPPPSADGGQPLVHGRVVDELGEPLGGGSVSVQCLTAEGNVERIVGGTATLAEDGSFSTLGCTNLVCVDLHHATALRAEPWVLHPGRVGVLRAQGLARLEGVVEDPDGDPVPAANVVAVPGVPDETAAVPPYTATATVTDDLGTFSLARIERPPCDPCAEATDRCMDDADLKVWSRVRITARAPGFGVSDLEIDPDEAGPISIRLDPPRDPIEGTVAGEDTNGLSILARSDDRAYEVHRVTVAEGGAFVLDSLGPGPYTLRVLRGHVEVGRLSGASAGDRLTVPITGPAGQ